MGSDMPLKATSLKSWVSNGSSTNGGMVRSNGRVGGAIYVTLPSHAEATNEVDWDDNEDAAMEKDSGVDGANKGGEADQVEATADTEEGQREEEAYATI